MSANNANNKEKAENTVTAEKPAVEKTEEEKTDLVSSAIASMNVQPTAIVQCE